MELGMVGLGKMGINMVFRLLEGGHKVVVFNRTLSKEEPVKNKGAIGSDSIKELVSKLSSPRIVWLMVPSGETTDLMLEEVLKYVEKTDIVIDGGNSYYKDSIRRYNMLKEKGINFLDAGTSGGIWGLKEGYCSMIGGEEEIFNHCEPIFKTLAPENGYLYIGKSGAGHFVKMVHNAIEYGMMEAYAEGFEILKTSDFNVNLTDITGLWSHGSVVRSWLLDLAHNAFRLDPELENLKPIVDDSGEGRWTLKEAIDMAVPAPVLAESVFARFRSRQENSFANRVLAALRHQFGGHSVH
ncbi:MAG: decarboxylating 6-phosphogluconate dehydrogenase [Candidatus Acididesulfobacter diazotrophicus]|uniref:Decarboxylating 6-phosphogluconate dehydrogenase n=1 Tax=Candidatus Acididesulfobacter diazotrophicus TaxID=2597226 RepID=A0A519BMP2_9DELT|nr:MAG: decarboxylating 6-phosphogluconate dehydrogenase [Candidatus Acididesulfobacter diazotrophicus]